MADKVEDGDEVEEDGETWWSRRGFETEKAFWDDLRAKNEAWSRMLGFRPKPPAPGLPYGLAPERESRPGVRSCQVNVKLTPEDFEALAEAARGYGVASATMAQLLVNRGLEAIAAEDPAAEDPAAEDPAAEDPATSGW